VSAPEPNNAAAKDYDRLRQHLIDVHGYTEDYFDLCEMEGSAADLSALRWLHAPSLKTREYPNGCERL